MTKANESMDKLTTIVKVCKIHGDLDSSLVYIRPDNGSLRCKQCANMRVKKYQKKERSLLLEKIKDLEKFVHETLKNKDVDNILELYDSILSKLKSEIETNHISTRGDIKCSKS